MNLFITVILLAVASCTAGLGESCHGQADCDADECCAYFAPMRGKRQDSGVCKKRGTTKEKCFMENHFQTEGRYANICPCASGFDCVSLGYIEPPFGHVGTCQAVATKGRAVASRDRPCQSGADCPKDQCCQSRMRPIGRRALGGTCRPMGTVGSNCLASSKSGKPDTMTFSCPCSDGLRCKGNGFFDIPLGEMGTCEAAADRREAGEKGEVHCKSGADCPSDQCCVNLNRPIGRRQLMTSLQVCKPMGTTNSTCFAKSKPGKPDHLVYACPCSTGFHCKPNGIIDVPLGELGNCVADAK